MSSHQEAARMYLSVETDPTYIATVEAALSNPEKLAALFGSRLSFGTAGIRGPLAAGYTGMNNGIILQTAQGYCAYLIEQFTLPVLQKQGIVLGYDARRGSRVFAEITASVFLMKGVKVYLFSTIIPTPYVAFSIRFLKAAGGVMVTASHNPAVDNGYKVYWNNGAQIIEPHDGGIRDAIQQNLAPWAGYDQSLFASSPLCVDPLDDVKEAYNELIFNRLCFYPNTKSDLKIVYTAMHGVGHKPTLWAFKKFGLPTPVPVPEQVEGNGDFPTSAFPNPEEISNFNYAIKRANSVGADVIICQDPDADRVGLAVRKPDGEFMVFHGNHTGALLTWWQMKHFKGDKSKARFFSSTVSTQFQGVMARAEGFQHSETLTGFKWLGNAALIAESEGEKALLAFEEAIGFGLLPGEVPDKDAISAAAVVAEMAHYLRREENKSLIDKLEEIYKQYGFFLFNNSFFMCYDKDIINALFQRMRTGNEGGYITKIGEFKISGIRDMTLGFDSRTEDKKPVLPKQSGQMITFYLENGCAATIRTSGTEPKIKWYIEIGAADKAKAEKDLAEVVEAVEADLLQRDVYNLKHA